jgi:hypothetical protein
LIYDGYSPLDFQQASYFAESRRGSSKEMEQQTIQETIESSTGAKRDYLRLSTQAPRENP